MARGRDRYPQILTNFYKEGTARFRASAKQYPLAKRHVRLATQCDGVTCDRSRRGELPQLIKLAIIRQKCLGDNAQDTPPVQHYSAVEEQVINLEWQSHNGDQRQRGRRLLHGLQGLGSTLQEGLLVEQVIACIR